MPFIQTELLQRIVALLRAQPVPCYITGGYVRDWLLGKSGKDVDFTVAHGAIPLARRVANTTGGAFYVLDQEMDAARIVYRDPEFVVDFAGLRDADITADLQARDLTINAMGVDVRHTDQPDPPVLDPCGGQCDLAAHILRATHEGAFRQDPVRLLRAVRFEALFAMPIDPDTEAWLRRDASLLVRPSAERIRQELALIVAAPGAAHHLRRMDELGLLAIVLPEMVALKGVAQPPEHHAYDVYEHTLASVAEVERLTTYLSPLPPLIRETTSSSPPMIRGATSSSPPLIRGATSPSPPLIREATSPSPPLSRGARGDQPAARLHPEEEPFLAPFAAELAAHFGTVLCEKRTRATLLRFAAMLHDVGKPQHRTVTEDGHITFHGHEDSSAEMARTILTRLRFSAQEVQLVAAVVAAHMRPGFLVKAGHEAPVTRRAMYRFFRDTGDAVVDVLIFALADHLAARGTTLPEGDWPDELAFVRTMLELCFRTPAEVAHPPPLVTGRDVMSLLHIPPGPQVGRLLEAVREAQAEGQVRTREEALEFLRGQPLA